VHQVLERFHTGGGTRSLAELLGLLDAGWRRGGFGDTDQERQLRGKAGAALTRYFERFQEETAEPMWFERAFAFKLGPHLLRGRLGAAGLVVDQLVAALRQSIDAVHAPAQLQEDIQLSLYAVGAREAWQLEAAQQAYYYVLDDEKVPVQRDDVDRDWITETVLEVADGILAQGFEPTPSYAACSTCDFRIICPAAER
jgi:DNA helicase-2/ATP-dependent DNA helicase PcrA